MACIYLVPIFNLNVVFMLIKKLPIKGLRMFLRGGLVSLAAVLSLSESLHAQNYEISNSTHSGGGGISTDSQFSVLGTIGQAVTGPSYGGGFQLQSGYLATKTIICAPSDLNCDSVTDSFDLGELLLSWGDCPNQDGCCIGDINADFVIDSSDLSLMLVDWG